MKSEQLISNLSRHPPRNVGLLPDARVAGAALLSLILVMALSVLWLRPRDDLATLLLVENHLFLLKLFFTVGVSVSVLPIVCDLCVPGRRIRFGVFLLVTPFAVLMILVLREIAGQQFDGIGNNVGRAWLDCLWQIPSLAAPAFVILAITARRLGPTDLRRTGAFIGVLAGAIGAVGYALHCSHDSVVFVGVAYSFGIIEVAVLGTVLGPRLLRWV